MNENGHKIKLVVTENGLQLSPEVNLLDYGFSEGDKCLFTIDDETGEAKLQKILDALMEEIEIHDELLMNAIIEESTELPTKIQSSKIPKAGLTIISLLAGMNSLKLGVYELCKSRDLYSISVLYRVFLEHFVKINYFCDRLVNDKNDDVGEEYFKFYAANEKVMYGKSIEELNKIIDLEYHGRSFENIVHELCPELKEYSTQELREKILQFNYKNMIKYLVDNHKSDKLDKYSSFVLSIIPEYSELSSFVHGGPNAVHATAKKWESNEIELECCQYARATFSFYVISNLISLLLFMNYIDRKYSSLYQKVNAIWEDSRYKIEKYFETLK